MTTFFVRAALACTAAMMPVAAYAYDTPPSTPPGGTGSSSGGGAGSPTPIPEPGAIALFALGAAGVWVGRRASRRRSDD